MKSLLASQTDGTNPKLPEQVGDLSGKPAHGELTGLAPHF
jgi:hypothetical protein